MHENSHLIRNVTCHVSEHVSVYYYWTRTSIRIGLLVIQTGWTKRFEA